jgi:hypothetical protein
LDAPDHRGDVDAEIGTVEEQIGLCSAIVGGDVDAAVDAHEELLETAVGVLAADLLAGHREAEKIPLHHARYRAALGWYAPSMQVTLTPHGEELLRAELARQAGSSPEQILERALETLAERAPTAERKKTPAEAVAHIRESRKGVTLGGLKVKDLIDEGRKY